MRKLFMEELAKLNIQRVDSEDTSKARVRDAGYCDRSRKKGFWNAYSYAILYGITGCLYSTTSAYFNGIVSTLERRFNIPSKNIGIISMGNNISQIIVVLCLTFYADRGHRPKWISFGILTLVIYCLLSAMPHFLYGAGEKALALTANYSKSFNRTDWQTTSDTLAEESRQTLCGTKRGCGHMDESNLTTQIMLFTGHVISGIGAALFYTLGISYMDDNTERAKTPAMLSFTFFLNLLGPSLGYSMVSVCLSYFISPELDPVVDNHDPRWLGAWWMGWLLLAVFLLICCLCFRTLPKKFSYKPISHSNTSNTKISFHEMLKTFKRLCRNKTYMYNNVSSIFYFFGYTPYWIFTPKYIEIQFRQTAAASSLATGSVAFFFTAIGILTSGLVISRYKPSARYLAGWNVLVGFLSVAGIVSYAFIGCQTNEDNLLDGSFNQTMCDSDCDCEYVSFSPVCGENGASYISPCHAGCRGQSVDESTGKEIFYNCSCIPTNAEINTAYPENMLVSEPTALKGYATGGACPVDCLTEFYVFLVIMCAIKFLGAAGRTSNLIVSIRCVEENDKTVSMGLGMAMISLFTFIPSPIFFGWLFDNLCTHWGYTCTNKGNCWLYNTKLLRYTLNLTAAWFVLMGSLFDCGVWYYVEDLELFDADDNALEIGMTNY